MSYTKSKSKSKSKKEIVLYGDNPQDYATILTVTIPNFYEIRIRKKSGGWFLASCEPIIANRYPPWWQP